MIVASQTVMGQSPTVAPIASIEVRAMNSASSPYAIASSALAGLGYHPLPAKARGKGIELRGWPDYAHTAPSVSERALWSKRIDANVCAPMGSPAGAGLIVVSIDIDVDDLDAIDRIKRVLPAGAPERFGSKGSALLYRAARETETRVFHHKGTGKTLLEILSTGRQLVLPPSRHPNGNEYRWLTSLKPADELPVLTEDHLARLAEVAEALGAGAATTVAASSVEAASATSEPEEVDDNPVAEVNRSLNTRALANLDAWVGPLGLPNAQRLPDGRWQATAFWRPSGNGNPIEQRKRNLSFSPTGIADFGDSHRGYTATDVVMQALGLKHDKAFRWLSDRVGSPLDLSGMPSLDDLLAGEERRRQARGEPIPRRIVEHNDGILSDEETGEVLPPPAPRQVADRQFPDALTHVPGLLGDMVEHIVATARRPDRVLALGSALVCLGTIIGRRDATPTRSGTHLYVVALAGTGVGKDHPQSAGKALLRAAVAEHPGANLVGAPEYMSHTSLTREMESRPLRCSFTDEFGAFLQKVNGPRAQSHERGIKSVLLTTWGRSFDIYETPAWAGVESTNVYSPAYSIFGASTPGQFYDALQGDDRENGFLNRMLLMPTFEKLEAVDPAYDYRDVPDDLAAKLRTAYRVRRPLIENNPGMHVVEWQDDEAKRTWDVFRKECDDREDDAAFYVRSAEMAGRLATIRAIGRDIEYPEVSADDVRWAIEVVRWSAHRMAEDAGALVADTQVGRDRARVMGKINASPGRRVARSALMQGLGFSARDLDMLIRDMVEIGHVKEDEVRPASGGKAKRFVHAA